MTHPIVIQVVHSTLKDMLPTHLKADDPDLIPPDDEEIAKVQY